MLRDAIRSPKKSIATTTSVWFSLKISLDPQKLVPGRILDIVRNTSLPTPTGKPRSFVPMLPTRKGDGRGELTHFFLGGGGSLTIGPRIMMMCVLQIVAHDW